MLESGRCDCTRQGERADGFVSPELAESVVLIEYRQRPQQMAAEATDPRVATHLAPGMTARHAELELHWIVEPVDGFERIA
ncbi:MAG: hypothetical protein AB7P03_18350 [Kofleriaceae bacterium]